MPLAIVFLGIVLGDFKIDITLQIDLEECSVTGSSNGYSVLAGDMINIIFEDLDVTAIVTSQSTDPSSLWVGAAAEPVPVEVGENTFQEEHWMFKEIGTIGDLCGHVYADRLHACDYEEVMQGVWAEQARERTKDIVGVTDGTPTYTVYIYDMTVVCESIRL